MNRNSANLPLSISSAKRTSRLWSRCTCRSDSQLRQTQRRGPTRHAYQRSRAYPSPPARLGHCQSPPRRLLSVWTGAHTGEQVNWPIRNILCAVSLDEESAALARAAAALAKSFGARLTLFHAAGYPHPAIDVDYDHYRKQLLEDATQRLQALRWDNKIEANVALAEGSAVMCIISTPSNSMPTSS